MIKSASPTIYRQSFVVRYNPEYLQAEVRCLCTDFAVQSKKVRRFLRDSVQITILKNALKLAFVFIAHAKPEVDETDHSWVPPQNRRSCPFLVEEVRSQNTGEEVEDLIGRKSTRHPITNTTQLAQDLLVEWKAGNCAFGRK
jgi:hypothetical protein